MKLEGDMTINGTRYSKGSEIPWYYVYPFFLVHMGMFGLSGFLMAYSSNGADLVFLYLHGGFACLVYLVFYVTIFGRDSVAWMLINAGLGLFGIAAQIDWILSWFGRHVSDYPVSVHVIPFFYYILYTFLLHQMVLDIFRARSDPKRRRIADVFYVSGSLLVYGWMWMAG